MMMMMVMRQRFTRPTETLSVIKKMSKHFIGRKINIRPRAQDESFTFFSFYIIFQEITNF